MMSMHSLASSQAMQASVVCSVQALPMLMPAMGPVTKLHCLAVGGSHPPSPPTVLFPHTAATPGPDPPAVPAVPPVESEPASTPPVPAVPSTETSEPASTP